MGLLDWFKKPEAQLPALPEKRGPGRPKGSKDKAPRRKSA
jgi:hypothetical protein